MSVEALAAAAIAVVTPYIAAGAKKAAETIGEDLVRKVETLWGKMRAWMSSDNRSKRALENFEADAGMYSGAATMVLKEILTAKPELQGELQRELDGLGSRLIVRQKIEILAGQATGLDVGVVLRGLDAAVDQDVGYVAPNASITGAKISQT